MGGGVDRCLSSSAASPPVHDDGRKEPQMALKAVKQVPKQPEAEAKRHPDFVVRAKLKDGVRTNIGAAWSAQLKDGVVGYSLKITNMPVGWNGDALLMPPIAKEE